MAFYTDRASLFRVNRGSSVEEQLEGEEAQTQIGRALRELGIEWIAAYCRRPKDASSGFSERLGTLPAPRSVRIKTRVKAKSRSRWMEEFDLQSSPPLWKALEQETGPARVSANRS